MPRDWKFPTLRDSLIPHITVIAGERSNLPIAPGCPMKLPNACARTKPTEPFISQVINWAASLEPLLLLPGHIPEINLRANEANYQWQTWFASNYVPWKGHPKQHIVKLS